MRQACGKDFRAWRPSIKPCFLKRCNVTENMNGKKGFCGRPKKCAVQHPWSSDGICNQFCPQRLTSNNKSAVNQWLYLHTCRYTCTCVYYIVCIGLSFHTLVWVCNFECVCVHARNWMPVYLCLCFHFLVCLQVRCFFVWSSVCGRFAEWVYVSATVLQSAFHGLVWTQSKAPSCFRSTLNHGSPHHSLILSDSHRPDLTTSVCPCSQ